MDFSKRFFEKDLAPSRDYSLWKDIREYAFSLIKGKKNLPVSFALSFRKSISRHWGVSAGLQYTYLSSESSIGEDSKWVKRQKFHYIGLSVKLDRRLYTTRTFSFYTTGGGTIDKFRIG